MVAYLPVKFEAKDSQPTHKSREARSRSRSKVDKLRALHGGTESRVNPFEMSAETGLSVEIKKRTEISLTIFPGLLWCRPSRNRRPVVCGARISEIHSVSYLLYKTGGVSKGL